MEGLILTDADIDRIASAVVEKAAEDVGVRDIMIGSAMGSGAIPLYGRETRKEPCACCLIDPAGPNAPENRMCTTKGAIGILNNREEVDWCSEIKIVPDGRCARARSIAEAARECKEKHPDDTEAFFRCYIPAFSQITAKRLESNPGNPRELEAAIRGTPGLASSRYITKKLDTWRAIDKCTFRKAYEEGNWKAVGELTPDLTGSAYSRQRTLSDLYSVLLELKCE